MLGNSIAIASVSLGQHINHTLPSKIIAAAEYGFNGIEITHPDLEAYAKGERMTMLEAARKTSALCKDHNFHILAFASFQNYEGSLLPLSDRLKKATVWLDLAHALKAEHLQIPSNYERKIDNNNEKMISELRQLADMAAQYQPPIKVAYENLAWSSHCTKWQEAAKIVQEVDRENFGLCLDSFHISTLLWADPYTESGRQPNGGLNLRASMKELVEKCPVEKLFYLQLSDGELMDPPYSTNHPWYDPSLEVEHVWSNEARPFPLEEEYGAYVPVTEIADAFLKQLGFTGWVSLETFDRRMRAEERGPGKNAKRGIVSWHNLRKRLSNSEPPKINRNA